MIEVSLDKFGGRELLIDGKSFSNVFIRTLSAPRDEEVSVSAHEDDVGGLLLNARFSDLPKNVAVLSFAPNYTLISGEPELLQNVTVYKDADEQFFISLEFEFHYDNWKRPWSVAEYRSEFIRIMGEYGLVNGLRTLKGFSSKDIFFGDDDYIALLFPVQQSDEVIEVEARKHSGLLTKLHHATIESLRSGVRSESVVLQFEFPEEVRVACEQYLLYFVQFLRDLGVEATAELQHYAGRSLVCCYPNR